MGKKAVILYFHSIMFISSLVLLILSIWGYLSADIDPTTNIYSYFISLILPGILVGNTIFVAYFGVRLKVWILIPIAALAINFSFIGSMFQFRLDQPSSSNKEKTIRIASYNVHYFSFDKEYTIYQIANTFIDNEIDIICFQEYIEPHDNRYENISDAMKAYPYFAIYNGSTDSTRLAIFSRYPVTNSGKIEFEGSNNGAMWADIKVSNSFEFRVFNNHLQTTGMTSARKYGIPEKFKILSENAIMRTRQAIEIRNCIDTTLLPIIVTGDFNDTPSSFVFNRIKGPNLIDGFKEAGSGYGSTFRWFKKLLRIDFIIHSKEFKTTQYRTLDLDLSDHKPVIAEMEYQN